MLQERSLLRRSKCGQIMVWSGARGACSRLWVRVLERQVESTDGTGIILLEPRLEAVGVVDVTARHEHSLQAELDIVAADGAAGRFHFRAFVLAVLLFDLYDGKLFHCTFLRPFRPLPLLGFLLAHPPDRLENVV